MKTQQRKTYATLNDQHYKSWLAQGKQFGYIEQMQGGAGGSQSSIRTTSTKRGGMTKRASANRRGQRGTANGALQAANTG